MQHPPYRPERAIALVRSGAGRNTFRPPIPNAMNVLINFVLLDAGVLQLVDMALQRTHAVAKRCVPLCTARDTGTDAFPGPSSTSFLRVKVALTSFRVRASATPSRRRPCACLARCGA